MDLTTTFIFVVIGGFTILSGLKFRTVDMILVAIDARDLARLPKLLRVAVTRRASLAAVRSTSP